MSAYNIILTSEAIYDIADIADYIDERFGSKRADRFLSDIKKQLQFLSQSATAFSKTQLLYRGYSIYQKPFPPSIIFYTILDSKQEIHILRVLRHEKDWKNILLQKHTYTYPN